MKKTLRTLLMSMVALLAGNALTSCSNEDELQTAPEGQKGYVEFSLSRGADTRTAYELTSDNGLKATWSEGDLIVVYYGSGDNRIVEVFDMVSGAGEKTATFAKKDSDLADKSGSVVIEYIPGFTSETDINNYTLDLSDQEGDLDNLGKYDVFAFTATLNNGKIESPEFLPIMSILHFRKDFDFGITATTADLVFSGGYNKIGIVEDKTGDITVKGVSLTEGKLSNDIYVSVYSTNSGTVPTTLTVGDKTFALPEIEAAGKIYNFAESNLREIDTEPLTIEAASNNATVTITNPLNLTIGYRWVVSDEIKVVGSFTEDFNITLEMGDKLQLFGDNKTYALDFEDFTNIQCTDECFIYGNIMSLVYADDFALQTELTGAKTFAKLFLNNTYIKNHPDKPLTLPATTLSNYCYAYLFRGCTSLTSAPELPATTMVDYCYYYMFYGCSGLTSAPKLPATILAEHCYFGMFYSCSSLITAPELPATELVGCCYGEMFIYCTSLTTAPKLPATTLSDGCYQKMFQGCTSLTSAPELPATTLKSGCYQLMFYNTSLTIAPKLPAAKLEPLCYYSMFKNCKSLNEVTCLATDISANSCVSEWLSGVASTGNFIKDASMTSWKKGVNGIPSGWTVDDYVE